MSIEQYEPIPLSESLLWCRYNKGIQPNGHCHSSTVDKQPILLVSLIILLTILDSALSLQRMEASMVRTILACCFVILTVMLSLYGKIGVAEENCLLDSCPTVDSTPKELNVLNNTLEPCSTDPLTGFYRDSFCRTGTNDRGVHVVCSEMTSEFLDYTKQQGNDLSTPAPQYGFPGLTPGDKWCLCAARWKEAQKNSVAPPVVLKSTSTVALQTVPLSLLLNESQPSSSNQP